MLLAPSSWGEVCRDALVGNSPARPDVRRRVSLRGVADAARDLGMPRETSSSWHCGELALEIGGAGNGGYSCGCHSGGWEPLGRRVMVPPRHAAVGVSWPGLLVAASAPARPTGFGRGRAGRVLAPKRTDQGMTTGANGSIKPLAIAAH
jgi:hypothetical protein